MVLNANSPNIVIVYKPAALLQPVNNYGCMHLYEQLFYTCLVLLSYTPYHVKSKSVNQLVRTSHLAVINLQTTHAQEALHQAREKRNTSAYLTHKTALWPSPSLLKDVRRRSSLKKIKVFGYEPHNVRSKPYSSVPMAYVVDMFYEII